MSNIDKQYQDLLGKILGYGSYINSRNSVTKRLGTQMLQFDSTPIITVRKTSWKLALREMEWFLSGSNNINDLHSSVHNWWKPWANEDGTIPNLYGEQLRAFKGKYGFTDQIEYLINNIIKDPYSRRNVISCWNTNDMINKETNITNCHGSMIQTFISSSKVLDLTMYQRSADVMLGVPHNWIQYWALMQYLAHHTGTIVGTFTWLSGDTHIYEDHIPTAIEITKLKLDPNSINPILTYNPTSDSFKADDFSLIGEYNPIINTKLKMTV